MVHHNFKKGQKIYCILKNGSVVIDKYVKSTGHFLILENNKFHWSELRNSTIYKNISKTLIPKHILDKIFFLGNIRIFIIPKTIKDKNANPKQIYNINNIIVTPLISYLSASLFNFETSDLSINEQTRKFNVIIIIIVQFSLITIHEVVAIKNK